MTEGRSKERGKVGPRVGKWLNEGKRGGGKRYVNPEVMGTF